MNKGPIHQIKQAYWSMLTAWHRWRHPTAKVYSPHAWLDAVIRHLPRQADRIVYVDGGAHDGQFARQLRAHLPQLEIHAFEPNADLFPRLQDNLQSAPGKCYPWALAAQSQAMEIFINASPMTSSLLPRSQLSQRYFDQVTRLREKRVIQAVSLDDWFSRSGLDRVDLLKLDLQGYELEALKGAGRLLDRGIGCIYCEVHFAPFYEGSAMFADVDALLRSHGYRLYNLYHLATHLPEGQIGSADALYVLDRPASGAPAASTRRAA
ncbi:MAG TPA: FkbM family methyltransferase [Phycisphaeraceae bacterium]